MLLSTRLETGRSTGAAVSTIWGAAGSEVLLPHGQTMPGW